MVTEETKKNMAIICKVLVDAFDDGDGEMTLKEIVDATKLQKKSIVMNCLQKLTEIGSVEKIIPLPRARLDPALAGGGSSRYDGRRRSREPDSNEERWKITTAGLSAHIDGPHG